jgi:hypothetical protein
MKPARHRWTYKGDTGDTGQENSTEHEQTNDRLHTFLEALL